MNGLEIVIKNQNGVVYNYELHFDCPVCEQRRCVMMPCSSTENALANIKKYPMIQMICSFCAMKIGILHYRFRTGDFSSKEKYLAKSYEKLGWLPKNPISKLFRRFKYWWKNLKKNYLISRYCD